MKHAKQRCGNFTLDFQSISAQSGHYGTRTFYVASEHRVVRECWGTEHGNPPKVLPTTVEYLYIPAKITSEEEIRNYVDAHYDRWVKGPSKKPDSLVRQNGTSWPMLSAVLFAGTLWLYFVIDYWNHAGDYTAFFPLHLSGLLRYTNASYLICAGLPMAVFFLLSVLPDALGQIYPGYRVWSKGYLAATAVLLTVQTALMLASTRFYVDLGIAELLFGYGHSRALRIITACYVCSVPALLLLSGSVWLAGRIARLRRMSGPEFSFHRSKSFKAALWCTLLAVLMTFGSNLILNLLSATNYRAAAAYVRAFCTHNASNFKMAMISLISAPIMEEIAFRGVFCKWLQKASGDRVAIVISAVCFGLWHRNLGQFAYTFVLGILLGFIFLRTKSVIWPMLVHFLINLLAILGYSGSSASVFGAWPVLSGIRLWMDALPVYVAVPGLVVILFLLRSICRRIGRQYP